MKNKLIAVLLLSFLPLVGVSAQTQQKAPPKAESRAFGFIFGGQSWLGIVPEEISAENAGKFGLNEARGVGISKIEKDSPAEKAGLQVNDVIIAFDSEKIGSVRKLMRVLGEVAPDHKVELTILRNGVEQTVSVTVGKRNDFAGFPNLERAIIPPSSEFPPMPDFSDRLEKFYGIQRGESPEGILVVMNYRQIGIGLTNLTKQLGDYFGVTDGKGLLINDVRKESPAEKAGLKAGDVILEINGKSVASVTDFIRGLNEKKEGAVVLTILRNKQRQTISVTPEKSKAQNFSIEKNYEYVNR